jgi:D-glycero-beta-D-manno-heptose-7-phosphate kinase
VTAYLGAMLAAGATPTEAAIVSNYAAGVEVGKLGAATVSAAEVLDAYDALDQDAHATSQSSVAGRRPPG